MAKFVIRRPPEKITRKDEPRFLYLKAHDSVTINEVIKELERWKTLGVTLFHNGYCYECEGELEGRYNTPESDDSFNRRLIVYEKLLDEWQQWYGANTEKYLNEVARREALKKATKAKREEIAKLRKQIKDIEAS